MGDYNDIPLGNEEQVLDLSALGVETESTLLGRFLWLVLRVFALTFSAVTTAAFYWKYSGQAFEFLFGAWSPLVTALAGTIALDGASQIWGYIRGHKSDTVQQMAIARMMTYVDMGMSVLVTVIFLLLNAGFDVGIVAANGSLTDIGLTLHIIGVLVLTTGIAANFVAATLYSEASGGNKAAVQNAQLTAITRANRFQADMTSAIMTAQYQRQHLNQQLPLLARQQGAINTQSYLTGRFNVPTSGNQIAPAPSGMQAYTTEPTLDEIVENIHRQTGRSRTNILQELYGGSFPPATQPPGSEPDTPFFD